MQRPIVIGTRRSPLAVYQARLVQVRLAARFGVSGTDIEERFPVKMFTTSGDKLKGKLSEFGGKGLFTKELEGALLDGDIDVAVHSMKDVPTQHQDGLGIVAIMQRADPRDAFISSRYASLSDLPQGAMVGTASLRRRAQLAHWRSDLRFSLLRGNVGTRLSKLEAGECDATILAAAGLKRLGQTEVIAEIVDAERMLNAPAQGAIGIEARLDDDDVWEAVTRLNHEPTHVCVVAERAYLRGLDGSCRTPIAGLATLEGDMMSFVAEVYSIDGTQKFSASVNEQVTDRAAATALGQSIAAMIKDQIGDQDIWCE